MPKTIRQPAAAGRFYPADNSRLEFEVNRSLEKAGTASSAAESVKAIMVPHAGYDYSAPVAAYGYKALQGRSVHTVALICNSHSAYFDGIAIDDSDAWQTPLGQVSADKELGKKLAGLDSSIKFSSSAHKTEHSLEVQIPFLQTVLKGEFKIVPILFGNMHGDSYQKLAKALSRNLGEEDLVVISTDMSHYPKYEDANRIDKGTLEGIRNLDIRNLEEYIDQVEDSRVANEQTLICGVDGVKTIMALAKEKGWQPEILKYANSGDAEIGSKDQVVGYGAVAFVQMQKSPPEADPPLAEKIKNQNDNIGDISEVQKEKLLQIARETVESYVRDKKVQEFDIKDERLLKKEGAFVTLEKDGNLRGCIGQIIPTEKPLWQVVRDMAVAAATEDNRFVPVSVDELDKLEYEISILSVPQKIDDWQKIELGKHGVIVSKGRQGGVFLPQVATDTGWSKEEFLRQLCTQKAGLPPDCYKDDPDVELEVFEASVIKGKN